MHLNIKVKTDDPSLYRYAISYGDTMSRIAASVRIARDTGLWRNARGEDSVALKVVFEASRKGELWLEELGGKKQFGRLPLIDNAAEANVRPGLYLLLFRGKTSMPREEYSIEITAPAEAKWKPKQTEKSDDSCNIYGLVPITVK